MINFTNKYDISYSDVVEEKILNDGLGDCFKNKQSLTRFCQYYFCSDNNGQFEETSLSSEKMLEYWWERYDGDYDL